MSDNAMVEVPIVGDGKLVKTEQGILVLKGENIYPGGTVIQAGTIQIDQVQSLGAEDSTLTMAGGTLETRQEMALNQTVDMQRAGQFKVDADGLHLNCLVSGEGGVYKTGAGVLVLGNDANTYRGVTTVKEGVLQGTTSSIRGDIGVVAVASVDLTMQGSKDTYTGNAVGLGGTTGTVRKQGEGDFTFIGNSTVAWTVAHGVLIGSGSRFSGDVTLNEEGLGST